MESSGCKARAHCFYKSPETSRELSCGKFWSCEWALWERVHGLISHMCYGQEKGETDRHTMSLPSLL